MPSKTAKKPTKKKPAAKPAPKPIEPEPVIDPPLDRAGIIKIIKAIDRIRISWQEAENPRRVIYRGQPVDIIPSKFWQAMQYLASQLTTRTIATDEATKAMVIATVKALDTARREILRIGGVDRADVRTAEELSRRSRHLEPKSDPAGSHELWLAFKTMVTETTRDRSKPIDFWTDTTGQLDSLDHNFDVALCMLDARPWDGVLCVDQIDPVQRDNDQAKRVAVYEQRKIDRAAQAKREAMIIQAHREAEAAAKPFPRDDIESIEYLVSNGVSIRQIALMHGGTVEDVDRYIAKHGLAKPDREMDEAERRMFQARLRGLQGRG